MGFVNQHLRSSGDCEAQLKSKDPIGRWLSKVAMAAVGYQHIPTPEAWAKYDDMYQSGDNKVTVESRTNIRLWDACIQKNAEMHQWIRKGKGEADLIQTWGGYPGGWIGTIARGNDVRASNQAMVQNSNASDKEPKYIVPWNLCRTVVTIAVQGDDMLCNLYHVKGGIWTINNQPDVSLQGKAIDMPTNMGDLGYKQTEVRQLTKLDLMMMKLHNGVLPY